LPKEKIIERRLRPSSKKAAVIGFTHRRLAPFAFIDKQLFQLQADP
jgi:hypothetical protein